VSLRFGFKCAIVTNANWQTDWNSRGCCSKRTRCSYSIITITIWNLYSAAYKTEQRRWTE